MEKKGKTPRAKRRIIIGISRMACKPGATSSPPQKGQGFSEAAPEVYDEDDIELQHCLTI